MGAARIAAGFPETFSVGAGLGHLRAERGLRVLAEAVLELTVELLGLLPAAQLACC